LRLRYSFLGAKTFKTFKKQAPGEKANEGVAYRSGLVVRRLDNAMHQINSSIQLIGVHAVDSIIHLSNNSGLRLLFYMLIKNNVKYKKKPESQPCSVHQMREQKTAPCCIMCK